MTYNVYSCHQCPFCNKDNEYGRDSCNHPFNFGVAEPYNKYDPFAEMPKDSVHKKCPLKESEITIKLPQ